MFFRIGVPDKDVVPTPESGKWAIVCIGILAITEAVTCLLIVFAEGSLRDGQPWAVLLLLIGLVCCIAAVLNIMRNPMNR